MQVLHHCSWVMTRPAGRIRSCHKLTGRVGSIVQNLTDRVGLGQDRVGSGLKNLKSSRVGSGHDPRDTGHARVGPPYPAIFFALLRGSVARIPPADPTLQKLPASCPKASRASTRLWHHIHRQISPTYEYPRTPIPTTGRPRIA